MAGHGPGVAQTQIDVLVAVGVDDPGTSGAAAEQRERARPAAHPVHRYAAHERTGGGLGKPLRLGICFGEGLLFAAEQAGQAIGVDEVGGAHVAEPSDG
jgi:hypothetical protein